MTPEAPRRWALVKREQGVPDRDDSGSRWSVDHLFVDQDAVPTLVEVKRSTDTRIRREVVGQMLDYAANGVRYWPVDSLRAAFEATQVELGNDPVETVATLCEDRDVSVEEFFAAVGDNLRAGRIRMVFVADVIPDELMRITEFLNEQMTPGRGVRGRGQAVPRRGPRGHRDRSGRVRAHRGGQREESTSSPRRSGDCARRLETCDLACHGTVAGPRPRPRPPGPPDPAVARCSRHPAAGQWRTSTSRLGTASTYRFNRFAIGVG